MIKAPLFYLFQIVYKILSKTPLRHVRGMLELSNKIFRRVWPDGSVIDVQGNKMYINVNETRPALRYTFQAYGMNLIHEEETTRLFRQVVRPGDVVLDLGANIGYFTILAASLVGPQGKVYCFEPEPTNFEYLSKNIALNHFSNVDAHQKAVSDSNGEVELYICTYDSGHHTINSFDGIKAYARGRAYERQAITIESVSIDDFLKGKTDSVNVIKMDVEGAEALALEGMRRTLLDNDVKVFLEFFPLLIKNMGSDEKRYVNSLLNDFGFHVYAIGHDYDMNQAEAGLQEIHSYEQLKQLIVKEDDHINLYLTKTPVVSV